jgi:hypothetical protein
MGTKFDFAAVIIGPPRHGKTTVARELVKQHLAQYPTGYAVVHDPHRDFRDLCATYDDADAWYRALAAAPSDKPFPRGASVGGSADRMRELAVSIGRARNHADNVRVPILIVYDESSLMGTSGATHISQGDVELLSNRAHWGIGAVYNVQRPTALTEAFYSMATDVYVFALPSSRRTQVLEEYLGLPEHALDDLVGAQKYKFRHWRSGEGLV